jgi:hypothetical protein
VARVRPDCAFVWCFAVGGCEADGGQGLCDDHFED